MGTALEEKFTRAGEAVLAAMFPPKPHERDRVAVATALEQLCQAMCDAKGITPGQMPLGNVARILAGVDREPGVTGGALDPQGNPMTIHVLDAGSPMCRLTTAPAKYWPEGHTWISRYDPLAIGVVNCKGCRAAAGFGGH